MKTFQTGKEKGSRKSGSDPLSAAKSKEAERTLARRVEKEAVVSNPEMKKEGRASQFLIFLLVKLLMMDEDGASLSNLFRRWKLSFREGGSTADTQPSFLPQPGTKLKFSWRRQLAPCCAFS